MSRQKLITVTSNQVKLLEQGVYLGFIKEMISLGAHSIKDGGVGVGEKLDSIAGPYKSDEGSLLFVMNINVLKSGD